MPDEFEDYQEDLTPRTDVPFEDRRARENRVLPNNDDRPWTPWKTWWMTAFCDYEREKMKKKMRLWRRKHKVYLNDYRRAWWARPGVKDRVNQRRREKSALKRMDERGVAYKPRGPRMKKTIVRKPRVLRKGRPLKEILRAGTTTCLGRG